MPNVHSKKRTTCSGLMKTALNNVVLPTLFKAVNNIVQHCYTCLQGNSGSSTCSVLLTTLNNVGSTTLFSPVFIRPEQVVRFLLCKLKFGVKTSDIQVGNIVYKKQMKNLSRKGGKMEAIWQGSYS